MSDHHLKKNFGYYNRVQNEGQILNTEVLQFFLFSYNYNDYVLENLKNICSSAI